MTQEPITPVVRLQFSGGLTAEEGRRLAAITSATRDPAEVFRHVLMAFRVFTIRDIKERLAKSEIELSAQGLAAALDAAWVLFVPQMTPLATPMVGQAYLAAMKAVNGDVPPEVIAELAREHVMRVGTYFHESSKEALIAGFNTFVNRKIPPRAALERALQGYGLTMRQMMTLTALKDTAPMASAQPQDLLYKVRAYIGKALHQRFETYAHQEAHNLTNQANQVAWLWMVEHGQMNPETEKIWITARDERVCAICGPLHGKVVPITEQFPVEGGSLWVPGAHVNCRCWVRIRTPLGNLQINKAMYGISYPEAAEDWSETEHPRSSDGRFTDKHRTRTIDLDSEFMRLVGMTQAPPTHQETPKTLPRLATAVGGLITPMAVGEAMPALTLTQVPELELQRLATIDLTTATAQEAAQAAQVQGVTIGDLEAVNPDVDLDAHGKALSTVDTTPDMDHVYSVDTGPMPRFSPEAMYRGSRIEKTRFFSGPDARAKAYDAAALAFEKKLQKAIERVEDSAERYDDSGIYIFHNGEGSEFGLTEQQIELLGKRMALHQNDNNFIDINGETLAADEAAELIGFDQSDFTVNVLKMEKPEEIRQIESYRGQQVPGGKQALHGAQGKGGPMRVKGFTIGGPVEIVDDTLWRDPQDSDDAHPYVRTITIRRAKGEWIG